MAKIQPPHLLCISVKINVSSVYCTLVSMKAFVHLKC